MKIDFNDDTSLTVRLTSMGHFSALKDNNLKDSYVYRRDFNSDVPSPIDDEFTLDLFSKLLAANNRMLKSVLVGKDAVLVGLSNSAFQDIIYRAGLHPKRKAAELTVDEKQTLHDAICFVLRERIRLNGKDQFSDIYGAQGRYSPAMGPNMKEQTCQKCGTPIEKMNVGGGYVYLCPTCQI